MLCFALLWLSGASNFLLVTLPTLRQINYITLPDPVLRPLVTTGLVAPKGIAVDPGTHRLFVTDSANQKIYWYQLISIGEKLITDGRQHVAVESVEANWISVDGQGNLYFSGKILVLPPMTPVTGIWKHPALYIASGQAVESINLWSGANTGAPSKIVAPSGITNDNLNVYWGNAQGGQTAGSVVKATTSVPSLAPESVVKQLSLNEDMVHGLCVTPLYLFYSTPDGIFGVSKNKIGTSCENDGCVQVASAGESAGNLGDPQGIVWDGDGTVYVADAAGNRVLSFPAGALQPHELIKVADAPRVTGLALLQVVEGGGTQAAAWLVSVAWLLML